MSLRAVPRCYNVRADDLSVVGPSSRAARNPGRAPPLPFRSWIHQEVEPRKVNSQGPLMRSARGGFPRVLPTWGAGS